MIGMAEWISLKDRLPDADGSYLVYAQFDGDEYPSIHIFEFDSNANEFGSWHEYFHPDTLGSLGCDFEKYPAEVLYWMPLPEPPKEVQEDG